MSNNQRVATRSYIEQLCGLRKSLIDSQLQSLLQTKRSFEICQQINAFVTPAQDSLIDTMHSVFHTIKQRSGEDVKPRPVNAINKTDEELADIVQESVDGHLWQLLFNRLNIYQLMNASARESFITTCKKDPIAFTSFHVIATVESLYEKREETMLESLMDAVVKSDPAYASNSKFSFGGKIVFKNALSTSVTGAYTIEDRSLFRDTLRFLSCFIFADDTNVDMTHDKGVSRDHLYVKVRDALLGNHGSPARLKVEMGPGHGRIELFKNGNAHILFEESLRNYLNDLLSKTKTLRCSSGETF